MREKMRNVCLLAGKDHLGNALSTLRGTPAMETEIISWKILNELPHILPIGRAVVRYIPPLGRVQMSYWSDRRGYRNKTVIRGAQWRKKLGSIYTESWEVRKKH